MDNLHETLLSLEDGLGSSDSPGLLSSWDWKSRAGPFELNQASPNQSISPAPSLESYTSSPCPARAGLPCGRGGASNEGSDGCSGRGTGGLVEVGYNMLAFQPAYLQGAGGPKPQKGTKVRMSVQRRRKASEREKLRMRTLADALHTLRNYLPPIYSQRGQPLTKIQTLKYTIKYIGELTDLLDSGRDPRPRAPEPREPRRPGSPAGQRAFEDLD